MWRWGGVVSSLPYPISPIFSDSPHFNHNSFLAEWRHAPLISPSLYASDHDDTVISWSPSTNRKQFSNEMQTSDTCSNPPLFTTILPLVVVYKRQTWKGSTLFYSRLQQTQWSCARYSRCLPAKHHFMT